LRFSIITCTWNSAAWLGQSIRSVLSQDYADYEYIFVDGGSTDRTLERIRTLERPFKLLENVRGGVPVAMNAGLAAASGDIVAHLHSDDYYLHPRVLSHVAEALQRSGRKWAIGTCVVDRDGELQYPPPRPHPYSSLNYAAGRFSIAHPAVFVGREVWQKVGGFNSACRYTSDIDLWLRICPSFEPVIIDEPLAAFRVHAGSRSSADAGAARAEELRVRCRHLGAHPIAAALGVARLGLYYGRLALAR
jgi:glycosyltransferase involved in cell wall biosynthesis